MATRKRLSLLLLQLLLVLALHLAHAHRLKLRFYKNTCPNAEAIVRNTTYKFISKAPTLAAALLRMHFHDCFVRGCDGSVLLTSSKENAERDASPNRSLRGFQVIDAVKSALEEACPCTVSCADIIALVARDAVSLIGGPFWDLPTGRRDGRVSLKSEVRPNVPSPSSNVTVLKQMFSVKGLSVKDLVVLSGSHTIGISHCRSFGNRLYNFTGKGEADPSMDPNYVVWLKKKCKPGDRTTLVEMDPGSFRTFDVNYYKVVTQRRGLFQSDAALLNDVQTQAYVKLQAENDGVSFAGDFAISMVKMGKIGVLTGKASEIRKKCAFVN